MLLYVLLFLDLMLLQVVAQLDRPEREPRCHVASLRPGILPLPQRQLLNPRYPGSTQNLFHPKPVLEAEYCFPLQLSRGHAFDQVLCRFENTLRQHATMLHRKVRFHPVTDLPERLADHFLQDQPRSVLKIGSLSLRRSAGHWLRATHVSVNISLSEVPTSFRHDSLDRLTKVRGPSAHPTNIELTFYPVSRTQQHVRDCMKPAIVWRIVTPHLEIEQRQELLKCEIERYATNPGCH